MRTGVRAWLTVVSLGGRLAASASSTQTEKLPAWLHLLSSRLAWLLFNHGQKKHYILATLLCCPETVVGCGVRRAGPRSVLGRDGGTWR